MSLVCAAALDLAQSFPRSRGDEPYVEEATETEKAFSPLTRG